jgi:hypothetical protein
MRQVPEKTPYCVHLGPPGPFYSLDILLFTDRWIQPLFFKLSIAAAGHSACQ